MIVLWFELIEPAKGKAVKRESSKARVSTFLFVWMELWELEGI